MDGWVDGDRWEDGWMGDGRMVMGGWIDGWEDSWRRMGGWWMDGSMVGRMGDEAGLQLNWGIPCVLGWYGAWDGGCGSRVWGEFALRVHSAGCPGLSLSPFQAPYGHQELCQRLSPSLEPRERQTLG